MSKSLYLVGSATGIGAAFSGCAEGPFVLQNSPYMKTLAEQGIHYTWEAMLKPTLDAHQSKLAAVSAHCKNLADVVCKQVEDKHFFTVLGGDHSCAIGTWHGAQQALKQQGPIGLIWIDAHMDSHTPETSPSGNLHGMPLACLLGFGPAELTDANLTLKPAHICLIGIRSFEAGEVDLLNGLNVRIFYIEEVKRRGLAAVMTEALSIVKQGTVGYGMTIDVDSIDPVEAPGTGTTAADGLHSQELFDALKIVANDTQLIGTEIVEFDPHLDQNSKTEKLISQLMMSIVLGKTIV